MGPSPHIRTSETVESVMYDVIIALIPAFLVAVYVFGLRAVIVTGVAVLTCLVTEYVCQKIMKQDISIDRKSTRLNSSHANISYAVFCLKKKKNKTHINH